MNGPIVELDKQVEKLTRDLKREEDALVNGIQKMIDTINRQFSDLMDKMDFAGEVKIIMILDLNLFEL